MDEATLLCLLAEGELLIEGRIAWGSNYTFLGRIVPAAPGAAEAAPEGDEGVVVIYKPQRGEQPLWDFPAGTLCQRERAAWIIGRTSGWNLVPPTILRDGRFGWGSVQLFVPHDPANHFFTFQDDPALYPQLQQIVLFDLMVNNADRKSGHVLLDDSGKLWAIDHGICFHAEDKLRTVIRDFAGQPVSPELQEGVARIEHALADGPVLDELTVLLTPRELRSLRRRVQQVRQIARFPYPRSGSVPWPPV
jgi:hypothetical protein